MPRKPSKTLTDGELRIMEAVWEQQQATVKSTTEALQKQENLAYNTVQTMMRILEDKGYLRHEKRGRSFVYTPLIGRQSARTQALRHFMSRFFDDSPQALMANLLEDQELDASDLQRLKALIQQSEEQNNE